MFSLNFRYSNWITIKNSLSLLLCLSLFACSTSNSVNPQKFSENAYDYINGNMNEQFYDAQFALINKENHKYTHHSDHQLMMALLNRPVTADQAMMIAFEQERINYSDYFSSYGVEIKGDKNTDKSNYRADNSYTNLILQDINAVSITAPN